MIQKLNDMGVTVNGKVISNDGQHNLATTPLEHFDENKVIPHILNHRYPCPNCRALVFKEEQSRFCCKRHSIFIDNINT